VGYESVFNLPGLEKLGTVLCIPPQPHSHSSMEFKSSLLNAVRAHVKNKFLEVQNNSPNQHKRKSIVAPLPASVVTTLEVFKDEFDPKLLPYIIKGVVLPLKTQFLKPANCPTPSVVHTHISDFSTLESQLFTLGLLQYGFQDLQSIRAYFLPIKSKSQLKSRFNNVKYRKNTPGMEKIKVGLDD
jgi:hypothetical protein